MADKDLKNLQLLVEGLAKGKGKFKEIHENYLEIAENFRDLYEQTVANQVKIEKKLMGHKIDLYNSEATLARSAESYQFCQNNEDSSWLHRAFTNVKGKVLEARLSGHQEKQDFYVDLCKETQQKSQSMNEVAEFLKYTMREFGLLYFSIHELKKNLEITETASKVFKDTEFEEGAKNGKEMAIFSFYLHHRNYMNSLEARIPSYDSRDMDFRHINPLMSSIVETNRTYDKELEGKAQRFFENGTD
ncbi:MAG: hypothetical protein KAT77_00430 [Nanoarchaeota archaeon]|nr:hypothetical protein [Nanoarchaeota archaeon]